MDSPTAVRPASENSCAMTGSFRAALTVLRTGMPPRDTGSTSAEDMWALVRSSVMCEESGMGRREGAAHGCVLYFNTAWRRRKEDGEL